MKVFANAASWITYTASRHSFNLGVRPFLELGNNCHLIYMSEFLKCKFPFVRFFMRKSCHASYITSVMYKLNVDDTWYCSRDCDNSCSKLDGSICIELWQNGDNVYSNGLTLLDSTSRRFIWVRLLWELFVFTAKTVRNYRVVKEYP